MPSSENWKYLFKKEKTPLENNKKYFVFIAEYFLTIFLIFLIVFCSKVYFDYCNENEQKKAPYYAFFVV